MHIHSNSLLTAKYYRLRLHDARPNYRAQAGFKTFLYRIARNRMIDLIRQNRIVLASELGGDEDNESVMQPKLSGLVVVAGSFGQGKTTTASSIVASRLKQYGGVGVTIEDPPEMPLEGAHGKGVCYQTWVAQGGFGAGCRQAARWAPSIIFLGEVRDEQAASEALRASINGGLVVCTTHADSVTMAIERLYALASGSGGNPDDIASLLAGGLLCVLHQKLEGQPRRPKIEFLWLGDQDNIGVRGMLRNRRFEQIQSEISMQVNRMLSKRNTVRASSCSHYG